MNKTVTINLSGIIFHIEEDAFQKLHQYLNTIRSYFSDSEGRDEIMADIENRIAEMFSEKISGRKQVVVMADVNSVIEIMGKPEDFGGERAAPGDRGKEEPKYSGARRRVFRDPDHKILGGVCAGIAAYFNINPLWLRLALVVAFFGFGIGFLLYIVLWMIIPEAKTYSEKLEMHGEKVNFSNIGKKVEEEMSAFGKRMENWGEKVKQRASGAGGRGRDFIDQFIGFIGSVLGAFFRVFGKLLGVFLVIIGMFLLIPLISSLFGEANIIHIHGLSFSLKDFFENFFANENQMLLAVTALVLFLGVPLVLLIYGGLRLLLGIKTGNRYLNFTAGILWLLGLALAVLAGIQIENQFTEKAVSKEKMEFIHPRCDTLFLRVKKMKGWNANRFYRSRPFHISIRKRHYISADSQNIYFRFPTLDIVKSETDSTEIITYFESRGENRKEALRFAKNITYEIFQKDSLLEFMPYFSIPANEKWRNQQVHVEVRVPTGKTVYLSKNMTGIIYDIRNETDTWDEDMVGRRWRMGAEELHCVDCDGIDERKNKKWKKKNKYFHSSDEEESSE